MSFGADDPLRPYEADVVFFAEPIDELVVGSDLSCLLKTRTRIQASFKKRNRGAFWAARSTKCLQTYSDRYVGICFGFSVDGKVNHICCMRVLV